MVSAQNRARLAEAVESALRHGDGQVQIFNDAPESVDELRRRLETPLLDWPAKDPDAARKVMARMRDQAAKADPLAGLTPQERTVLELIGEGLTNRQIGERMFLAEKTIKNYVSSLFAKLGMERRTQAAAYAAKVFSETEHPANDY